MLRERQTDQVVSTQAQGMPLLQHDSQQHVSVLIYDSVASHSSPGRDEGACLGLQGTALHIARRAFTVAKRLPSDTWED